MDKVKQKKGEDRKMGIVRNEEVIGYRINQELVCADCLTDKDKYSKQDVYLENEWNGEDEIFCDRCDEKLR